MSSAPPSSGCSTVRPCSPVRRTRPCSPVRRTHASVNVVLSLLHLTRLAFLFWLVAGTQDRYKRIARRLRARQLSEQQHARALRNCQRRMRGWIARVRVRLLAANEAKVVGLWERLTRGLIEEHYGNEKLQAISGWAG